MRTAFHNLIYSLPIIVLSGLFSSCHSTTIYNCAESVESEQIATNDRVDELLQQSFWMALGFLFLVLGLAWILYSLKNEQWNTFWKKIERNLTALFIVVWFAGFCVYSVGTFILEGNQSDFVKILSIASMAVIHAFGMFLLDSDVSAVHSQFHSNLHFMTLFSLVHFAAAFVSMMFVIKHFGYNIIASIQLWATSHGIRKKTHLYVFWGVNEESYILAKDIQRNAKKSFRILFVKTADDDNTFSSRTEVDRLLNFLTVKNRELKQFKELNCLSTNTFYQLSKIDLTKEERENKSVSILRDKLGVYSLARLFDKTEEQVHILLLDDDAESNIKAASNLCADIDLNRCAHHKKVIIYCHARYDSVNRVIENEQYVDNLEVKVIDSAHMSIETLKGTKDELCIPVDYVDVEEDATVSSPFRSMVIGLGECGRDAVSYLYEYGAFVGSGSDANNAQRSNFRCDVFDKSMNHIGPIFKSMRPGADISSVQEDHSKSFDHLINLYKSDTDEQLFWNFVEANIEYENCIFITIKDDDAGINLAVRLLRYAIRKNANLERLRIFVRSYKRDMLPNMERIADHYNRSVVKSLNLKVNTQPIYIFGKGKDLYTWKNIIDDSNKRESYRYYNNYCNINEPESNLGEAWFNRRKKQLKDYPYSYGDINEVRRFELEDMENALHCKTKLKLIRKALRSKHEFKKFVKSKRNRTPKNTDDASKQWDRIMTVSAQTEHLRWNASHEMLGYTYNDAVEKSERSIKMQHTCLTTWNNITSDVTRGYDYMVVETSLRLCDLEN